MNNIILFDGECNFCDKTVQFIIKRDPKGSFKFASRQSEIGERIVKQFKIPKDIDSFILINNDRYYLKSSAALQVCKDLSGLWKFGYLFIIIPTSIRDYCYDVIASNRYKWFGKKMECMIPTKDMKDRFL